MSGSPVISLRERLRQSSRQWPIVKTISDRWFVPQASLEELITPTSILAELRKPGHPSATIQDDIPSKVHLQYHRTALRLFAILALINKTDSIHDLVREGISDKQLPLNQYVATQPLTRDSIRLCTKGKPDRPILGMASWDTTDFENFYREQWSVFAPVFEKKNEPYHYFFHDKQILPYTFDAKMGRKLHGVHGDVWKIDIHPAHQRAIDLELAPEHFAIKRHRAEESFQIERKVLKAIVNKPGSSFIDLYATYEMNSHFHMIFPWAPADLGKYWEKVPLPRFTKTNILWMLDQCKRIAEGLSAMHNYKSREQFMSYDPHQVVQPRDADKVDPNELLYGQHGDIKPENLLWYCKGSSVTDINGKLVLADFGLSAFNHLNSRSAKRGFQGSISYSPPDVIQGRPMTRAYDVWSLGCVYLEFITWLIFGYDGIRNFRTYRFERTFQKQYSNDTFYTELDKTTAIVRETVGFWISHLRKQDRCSQMLQDFLYVIQERMLLIEPKNRIPSQELAQRLQQFYQNSLANENYLLPTKSGRHEKREASKEESRERADNRKALGFLDVEEKEDAVEEFIENDQAIMNSLVDISKEVDLPSNDALFV